MADPSYGGHVPFRTLLCPITIFQLGSKNRTSFRLGKQELVKNNQNNQIQSITFCSMYFSKKGIRSVQWGMGQSPRNWVIFENFCIKSNFAVCKVTFNCKLQKKNRGSRMYIQCIDYRRGNRGSNKIIGVATRRPTPYSPVFFLTHSVECVSLHCQKDRERLGLCHTPHCHWGSLTTLLRLPSRLVTTPPRRLDYCAFSDQSVRAPSIKISVGAYCGLQLHESCCLGLPVKTPLQ